MRKRPGQATPAEGFEIGGWHFDNVVHLSFATGGFVRELFDRTGYYERKLLAYSGYHEKWLRYPAQNNLFPCFPVKKIGTVKGFPDREEIRTISCLRQGAGTVVGCLSAFPGRATRSIGASIWMNWERNESGTGYIAPRWPGNYTTITVQGRYRRRIFLPH